MLLHYCNNYTTVTMLLCVWTLSRNPIKKQISIISELHNKCIVISSVWIYPFVTQQVYKCNNKPTKLNKRAHGTFSTKSRIVASSIPYRECNQHSQLIWSLKEKVFCSIGQPAVLQYWSILNYGCHCCNQFFVIAFLLSASRILSW